MWVVAICSWPSHRAMSTPAWSSRMAAVCRLRGLPRKRHSAATMMLSLDLDQRTTGQVLGHSRSAQTDRYLHILADRRSVAAVRIGEALCGVAREGA
jgi:integrase